MDLAKIAADMIDGFLTSQERREPFRIDIQIDVNENPQAMKLMKLSSYLACDVELANGIRLQKLQIPGAVEEFLTALEEFVGPDKVAEIKERLRPTRISPKLPHEAVVQLIRRVNEQSRK